jgi:hypothetical protein
MESVQDGGAVAETSGAISEESTNIEKPIKPSSDASRADHEKYKRDMLKYKDMVGELQERVKAFEMTEQEQKGNFQKVIQRLKEENKDLKTKYAQANYNYATSKIKDSVITEAVKLGCVDPDTFYKLIDQDDIKTIEVDDSFNAKQDDIKSIIEKNMKKYERLGFFGKKVNVIDKAPSSSPNNNEDNKKPKTKEELLDMAGKMGFKRLK